MVPELAVSQTCYWEKHLCVCISGDSEEVATSGSVTELKEHICLPVPVSMARR